MLNYLNDKQFLTKLFKYRQRETKVRISSLTFDEKFIESIEGKATGGSINLDGKSAMRRTCSLSLIADNIGLDKVVWGINTKFNLEIGLTNPFFGESNNSYPETIWFPQGIFLITSFNQTISTNSNLINISGKDKMALLNGEIGGHFGQTTIIDKIETVEADGTILKTKYELDKIIYDLIYTYGNENLHNIIITDLEKQGLKMVKYIGQGNLYLKQAMSANFEILTGHSAYTLSTSIPNFSEVCEDWTKKLLILENEKLTDKNIYLGKNSIDLNDLVFSNFTSNIDLETQTIFKHNDERFLLYKIKQGDIVGYQATPMVYNDDLIAQPGETITSVLDKIVNMLGGAYEYFYNLKGQFVFQKKKIYIENPWQPYSFFIENNQIIVRDENEEFVYSFLDNSLISSMTLDPVVNKAKNDFIIYGTTPNGNPIHLRYAIDTKPTEYTTIRNNTNITYITQFKETSKINVDSTKEKWQTITPGNQLIYKNKDKIYFSMSKSNFNKNDLYVGKQIGVYDSLALDNEINQEASNNSINFNNKVKIFTITNIEKTLLGRYRIYLDYSAHDLNRKIYKILTKVLIDTEEDSEISNNLQNKIVVDWRELIYQMALDFHAIGQNHDYPYLLRIHNPTMINGKTGYEQYYTDLMGFWPQVYRYKVGEIEVKGWNQEKIQNPDTLLYWLEFLEGNSSFNALSVKNIGDRTLIKNDKDITCLFEKPVPPIVLYSGSTIPQTTLNYSSCRITPDLESALSIATFPKAAKTVIDTEIGNNTAFAKTLNITTVPLYFLDVNRKIQVVNLENNIQGQFLINSFNIPLNYNGTMSLSTSEIVQSLY